MEALMSAIRAGDYTQAYDTLRETSKGATASGASIGTFLLVLLERFDEAELLARRASLEGLHQIIRGERQRTRRWRDPSDDDLPVATDTPSAALYATMAAALARHDAALADRTKAELARQVRPVAGTITFADGSARPFQDIADTDDAIGQMLEAYGPGGLTYLPFDSLLRITVLPKRNFMDYLMPQVEVTSARGATFVYVPLLYACSATASVEQLRNGRMTMFEYVGNAKRGRGQRDFAVDGSLVGLQNIAAITFA